MYESRSNYRTSTRGSLRLISNKQNSLETREWVDRAQTLEMKSHKQIAMKSSKLTRRRQGFVSRSSHPKVLRLRWGRIRETVLKNPYAPLPRARSPLKPKVTYYGFLGEEWRLQTSCAAHNLGWAITNTPSRLGAQGSKSNKLESAGLTKTKCSRDGNEAH
jgi:hypothetical protein